MKYSINSRSFTMKVKILKNKHFFLKRNLARRMSAKNTHDVHKKINESHISIVPERNVGLASVK